MLPVAGSRSYAASDRYLATSDAANYRVQAGSAQDFVSIGSTFTSIRPVYSRGVTIDYQQTQQPALPGSSGSAVRCVIGQPTISSDLPQSAVSFTTLGASGAARSSQSTAVAEITTAIGSLGINLQARTIQADLTLVGRASTGEAVSFGPVRFTTGYDGSGGTFAGSIDAGNGTVVNAAGSLFGPAGREVGVAFTITQSAGGATTTLTGQLFGTR